MNGLGKTLKKAYIFCKKYICLFGATVLLCGLILYLMRQFSATTLLFDQILFSLIISFTLLILLFKLKFLSRFKGEFNSKDFIICLLATFLLMTSTLLNIDRSRSFYVLSWVGNGEISLLNNQIDLTEVKSTEKLSFEAIRQRISEQETRGLILTSSHLLSLSQSGKFTFELSKFLARIFRLQGWYLNWK